jgi:hypothetical protein
MPSNRYIRSHEAMTGDYRPTPPDWPEHRRARFDKIAGALPRGWWDGSNEPLLIEFVLAVEASERLQALLDDLDRQGVDVAASIGEIHGLLRQRDREAKRAIQLARAMRISQLSMPQRAEGRDSPADESQAPWSA